VAYIQGAAEKRAIIKTTVTNSNIVLTRHFARHTNEKQSTRAQTSTKQTR